MAQAVRSDDLSDPGHGRSVQQSPARRVRAEGLTFPGGEQQGRRGPVVLPVVPQLVQKLRAEHDHALASPLGMPDVDHAAQGVDVLGFQVAGLIDPQARGVDQAEEDSVFGHGEALQDALHLLRGEDHGEWGVLARHGDEGHHLRPAKDLFEQEAEGRIVASQPLWADGLSLKELDPAPDILLGGLVGRFTDSLLEPAQRGQILLAGSHRARPAILRSDASRSSTWLWLM